MVRGQQVGEQARRRAVQPMVEEQRQTEGRSGRVGRQELGREAAIAHTATIGDRTMTAPAGGRGGHSLQPDGDVI
jgi:hypothetical protein